MCNRRPLKILNGLKLILNDDGSHLDSSKLKHFVPLRCVVSVKNCFVGRRKSLEEVFLYFSKNDVKYSLLPAGLFKPNLYFELINHARNENIVLLMEGVEDKMK